MPEAWKNELRYMLVHNSKAEIEVVCDCGALTGGTLPLVRYLESRMQEYFLGEIPGIA
ncbi:hypothetical protein CPB86DRAFT_782201 [Serendipita vermifera]|nr:hypothetical protein CPB86DRAFT_782201 [Serendipita vermifera]